MRRSLWNRVRGRGQTTVPGPYVRRLRLSRELKGLREGNGLSIDALAREVGSRRQRISEIENCHVRPDDAEINKILDFFRVTELRRAAILAAAADARHVGWWEKISAAIGPRQALYADLESGAGLISEYQLTLLPGLLQIPEFTAAYARVDRTLYAETFDPERAVEARAARQANLARSNPPRYHVVIDELAIRRFAATAGAAHEQLEHIAVILQDNPGITVQVLPVSARIPGGLTPRSAFSMYQYPDPDDPVVVAVDTITSDLLLTEPEHVAPYLRLHQRLSEAALSRSDTFDFLVMVGEDLDRTG
ncbi:helix-turn-helix transcriptional regulator [Actinoplanes sp. NPDC026619]|uniref:helix-turn-helix domain-containing protein n=1 Tax=Actinoplanes sp. NPDC026619 TaxID=3155798 RepID=UPI00340BC6F8